MELKAIVLDIPLSTSAEEATNIVNEQYERGFHIHRAIDGGQFTRIFFVATTKPRPRA